MFSAFFISRPRFAMVISIALTLAGAVAYSTLPVDKFPELVPPVVNVNTSFRGADAQTVEETVAAPIEQEVNGVKNMLYMKSTSSNDGRMDLNVSFQVGTDVDIAAVQVQSRVERAKTRLPQEVQREGIKVEPSSTNMLALIQLFADDNRYDEVFLSNYMTLNIKDLVGRVNGVGRAEMFGARDYGMRVWLDPERLKGLNLSPRQVVDAIRAQNVQIPAGRVGASPTLPDQRFQFSVVTKGRLSQVGEFENIVVRANPDGSMVRIKDVARVELGAQNYDLASRLNGSIAATLLVYQRPGSNALAVVDEIRARIDEQAGRFPAGLKYEVTYDATEAIRASIAEVMETLYIAVALVILVVFIFLGSFRATVIPAIAVPVSLVTTFAFMAALGFSINTLSLFGLILAIGVVVDDAIIVVEATTRNIEERGMSPKDATLAAMKEVLGAVIASTLVLLAVFVPVSFMPGLVGRVYNQFALTISAAVVISSVNAVTLSPALCALILQNPKDGASETWLKRTFDRFFNPFRDRYMQVVAQMIRFRVLVLPATLGLGLALVVMFRVVPGGFVPNEDEGVIFANIQLPDAASLNRTETVMRRMEAMAKEEPTIANVISIAGFSMLGGANTSNSGMMILTLKDWSQRSEATQHQEAILRRVQAKFASIDEALIFCFGRPAITGLGNTGGVDYELQDRAGGSVADLGAATDEMVRVATANTFIARSVSTFRADVPRLFLELDRHQAETMGVRIPAIVDTLSTSMGAMYANDLTLFGRSFRVMVEAQRAFTQNAEDLLRLYVPNDQGEQVPLAAFARIIEQTGAETISRFNLYRSTTLTTMPAPGFSTGQVIEAMEQLSKEVLPASMGFEWSGAAVQEKEAAGYAGLIFGLAIIFVYLFLAAQYESFSIPIAVLLVVPLAILGAVLAQFVSGLTLDVYTQVGLVLLIGLTAKTAILLVEFAKQRREEGLSPVEAAMDAAKLRFRAVLMTAFTFLLGMLPMVIASGSGAASRRSLGTAVFGGTLVGVLFTVLFVPVFYILVETLRTRWKKEKAAA